MNSLKGLHHVSCVMQDPIKTIDFYTNVLGFQLIKKTIKLNDISNYHLYFSCNDENKSDVVSFFTSSTPPQKQVGTNCIDALSFLVNSEESLTKWHENLIEKQVYVSDLFKLFHYTAFTFLDVNNVKIYFMYNPLAKSIHDRPIGLGPVMIKTWNILQSLDWLTTHLNMKLVSSSFDTCLVENKNTQIILIHNKGLITEAGVEKIDHVAFELESIDALQEFSEVLTMFGDTHSIILDRVYYHSLYVRDPNRILFEFVNHDPGYTIDEPFHQLGEKLSIPSYLECFKHEIIKQLPPLKTK